jgi:hypothetical protein
MGMNRVLTFIPYAIGRIFDFSQRLWRRDGSSSNSAGEERDTEDRKELGQHNVNIVKSCYLTEVCM